MIVNVTTPVKPRCWNRETGNPVTVRHGIDSDTGEVIRVSWETKWSGPVCASWAGRGIGSTPETTHGPQAYGWAEFCKTCRHLPDEGRVAMGITDNNNESES